MTLYLKYRPKDFKGLVGQDFIKNTLQKATAEQKTVGAYLLCWPRWTGKTSTARILAKAVNCIDSSNWNPCNKCNICEAINSESLIDVIEIDAASNTWVENIRDIINKANFRPTNAKYKIYIIDEVHMLSKWAFNALLKILEEPPSFVKFILATTETHKVPETIISRCQRYDFKNISENNLKSRLEFIAKEEKIKIDEKSLNYIVKNSAWGLRNAISSFEQLTINSQIKYKNIIESLWIVNEEKLEFFLNKLLNKQHSIIEDYEELVSSGKNIKLFFKELIFFTKDKTILDLKNNKNISDLLSILDKLDETYSKTKNSLDENTSFLIGILKIINPIKKEIKQEKIKNQKLKKEEINLAKVVRVPEMKKSSLGTGTKVVECKKQELEVEDISDIFWEELKENIKSNLTSNLFDKKAFVKTLKELWAKWWLTMWIRASECFHNWNTLEIRFKTKFALNQISINDNKDYIKNALESMGMWNLELILK